MTMTADKPEVKAEPKRWCKWVRRVSPGKGILAISERKSSKRVETTEYAIVPMDHEPLAYWVAKLDDQMNVVEAYHVHLPRGTCECKGFERHGYCRHRDCLRHLIATGAI